MSTRRKKEKEVAEKRPWKRELPMIPGYILLILWLAFTCVAVGWMLLASVSTTKEVLTNNLLHSGFHFDNFYKVLVKQNVARYFLNSFIYATSTCIGVIIIAAPAAYILARYNFRFKALVNAIFASAIGIPIIMIILPLFTIMVKMNLTGRMSTLIFLYIFISVPFNVIFLKGYFQTLPKALEDSALIDGCTPMKTFWKIYLPLAQPGIITVTIFNFITVWNEYFLALIFVNKADQRTLALGLQSMIQSMKYTGDWAGMFAAIIIVFVPTFILYIFLSEKIISGVTGGAVKG